jgi:hypothetical protein
MSTVTITAALPLFRARYPEFVTLSDATVGVCFLEASLYCTALDTSPITDQTNRTLILNMLAAHVAMLNFGSNGNSPSDLVGRISNASEGSVSVATDMGSSPAAGLKAWYLQTKYGAAYWQATLQYRGARWVGTSNVLVLNYPGGL